MLDDFRRSSVAAAPRKRFIGSVALAVALYTALAASLIAATKDIIPPIEVGLDPVPNWHPPKEPPPAVAPVNDDKTVKPTRLPRIPHKVAATVLHESDTPLPPAVVEPESDGMAAATIAATVPTVAIEPPIAPPAPVIRPRELPGYRYTHLEYPPRALRTAISGSVVVEFDVLPDGSVAAPRIVSGPVEFHETVLAAARAWRFEPARQAGKTVRYRLTKRIVFRLEDA